MDDLKDEQFAYNPDIPLSVPPKYRNKIGLIVVGVIIVLLFIALIWNGNNNKKKSEQNLQTAIEYLKQSNYNSATDAVFSDIENDLPSQNKVTSQLTNDEINLYNYALAKENEGFSDYNMVLTYLVNVSPVNGAFTSEDIQNLKSAAQAKVDEQNKADADRLAQQEKAKELANSPEERKKRGVTIGMTEDDVLASSWGKPTKINKTTTAYGVHEQWVYNGGYLYFDDGILTSIQN